jgi:hypothetical protein
VDLVCHRLIEVRCQDQHARATLLNREPLCGSFDLAHQFDLEPVTGQIMDLAPKLLIGVEDDGVGVVAMNGTSSETGGPTSPTAAGSVDGSVDRGWVLIASGRGDERELCDPLAGLCGWSVCSGD